MEIFSTESLDSNMLNKLADMYPCCLIYNGDVLDSGKYNEIIESVPENLKKKTYATFVVEHEGHQKLFMFTLEYNNSIDKLCKLYENVEDPINDISPAIYNKAIMIASELPFYGFNESLNIKLPKTYSPLYRRVLECLYIQRYVYEASGKFKVDKEYSNGLKADVKAAKPEFAKMPSNEKCEKIEAEYQFSKSKDSKNSQYSEVRAVSANGHNSVVFRMGRMTTDGWSENELYRTWRDICMKYGMCKLSALTNFHGDIYEISFTF